jgi:hypothetical protein
MSRGTRIVSIGQEHPVRPEEQTDLAETEALVLSADDEWIADDGWAEAEPEIELSRAWLPPVLALTMIAAWTGFFAWSRQAELFAPASPARWSDWISAWSVPVLLICVVWLLAMRHSRREFRRFGDAANLLTTQSATLENRLVTVNQELSLAREFIASQSRDLETLGRLATERLSTHAERLQQLIVDNSAQLDSIGTVSQAALDNMEKLRGQLPVIASSAKDVTNNIANAGRTAHGQLHEMVGGFARLNEFGQASERQVAAIRKLIGDALGEFAHQTEQLDTIASQRFNALAERGEQFRTQLDGQEIEALAAIRSRAAALAEELEQSRELLDRSEEESLTSLRARLGTIRDESGAISRSVRDTEGHAVIAWQAQVARLKEDVQEAFAALDAADGHIQETVRARHAAVVEDARRLDETIAERSSHLSGELERRRDEAVEQDAAFMAQFSERLRALDAEILQRRDRQQQDSAAIAAHGDIIAGRLAELEAQITAIAAHGGEAEAALSASLQSLSTRFAASREALTTTNRDIASLTDASVRLLELIQAGVQHSSNDLPAAMAKGNERLESMETRIFALRDAVDSANTNSDKLSAYVLAAGDAIRSTIGELDGLHDKIDARSQSHVAGVQDLRASLSATAGDLDALAERTRLELSGAIELLTGTARGAVTTLEEQGATVVADLARKLSEESREAIDRAMQTRAAEIAGQLEEATANAAGVSREATVQLRDQLAKVNELTGNLERRIAHAREKAEEQVDHDFARRVALITEALNSNAIDIAKALSHEVSDSAWAAYLRGDRGIFTRRAVSLLDNGEARSIAQLYESDMEFAEHVNRYVHDFEAMLRQLLSTRDGHALGVTLLSSDMGKLYVALAQGIERLRS